MSRHSIISSHTSIVIALTLLLHASSQSLLPSYIFAKSTLPRHALASTATLDENVSSNERQAQSMPVVRLKATLAGHTKSITEIAFSPDGETVATGSEDGTVRLWSARTGKQKALLVGADKYARVRLIWSPDGRKLATTSSRNRDENRKAQVWDAGTGELKATLDAENSSGYISAWSPDGRTILTGSSDGTVKLWDAETGKPKATLEQEPPLLKQTDSLLKAILKDQRLSDESSTYGDFDASGQTILTASSHQPPKLWNAVTGELIATLKRATTEYGGYPYYLEDSLLKPGNRLMVWKDDSGTVLLDAATGQPKYTLGDIGRFIGFSPDGRTILTVNQQYEPGTLYGRAEELNLRDVTSGQPRLTFEKVPQVARAYWSPDGGTIVLIGEGRTKTRLLDAHTGRVKARLPYQGCTPDTLFGSDGCEPFIFSADGRVVLKLKETLKLWSTNTGELIAALGSARLPAAFSPTDKSLLATRGRDKKTLLLWEVAIK